MKTKVLLFDLGGVLLDFVGPEKLCAMLNGRFTLLQTRQMWPESPSLRKFELGHLSQESFADEFTREWDLRLSPEEFFTEFSSWCLAPLPGALALLEEFKGVAVLACLTNMNSAYWERVRDDMGFGSRFDHCYSSHEIGKLKPDSSAYQHVLSDLSCEPSEMVFFDDTWRNVEAARELGIRGYQTRGVIELKASITELFDR